MPRSGRRRERAVAVHPPAAPVPVARAPVVGNRRRRYPPNRRHNRRHIGRFVELRDGGGDGGSRIGGECRVRHRFDLQVAIEHHPGQEGRPAQQLAVDQASIDTAQANLTDSQQALGGANLVSTIAGTVASVSIAAGDSVTAGSTSAAAQIVVIGTGTSYEVTTDVPVASIGEVAVGQQVQITPDATNTVLNGQVESIGVLASSGSTSTTYPVTISLQSPDLGQLSGADANVAIIVKRSVDVTTVASSAVRTVGSIHLVTVVDNNTAKSVRVTLGTVGATLTQVTRGCRWARWSPWPI